MYQLFPAVVYSLALVESRKWRNPKSTEFESSHWEATWRAVMCIGPSVARGVIQRVTLSFLEDKNCPVFVLHSLNVPENH